FTETVWRTVPLVAVSIVPYSRYCSAMFRRTSFDVSTSIRLRSLLSSCACSVRTSSASAISATRPLKSNRCAISFCAITTAFFSACQSGRETMSNEDSAAMRSSGRRRRVRPLREIVHMGEIVHEAAAQQLRRNAERHGEAAVALGHAVVHDRERGGQQR